MKVKNTGFSTTVERSSRQYCTKYILDCAKDPLPQGRMLAVSHQDDTQGVPQRVIELLL